MDRIAALRAFTAAADAASFTAAADRLGMTPQAISKLVGALEADLGLRLLARTTRRMSLTETGSAYLERARAVLNDLDALDDDVRARRADPAGVLRVSAPVSFSWMHLAEPVAAFLRRYPRIEVRLEMSDRRVDLVEEGVDLAIRIGAPGPSTYVARRIAMARDLICASPAYLAERGTPRQPEDLAGHEVIVDTNLPRADRWRLSDGARTVDQRVRGRLHVTTADAAAAAARAGAGIVLGPSFVLGPEVQAGRLVRVLEGWTGGELPVNAVFPAAKGLAPKVRLMVDHLAERFGGVPPWERGV